MSTGLQRWPSGRHCKFKHIPPEQLAGKCAHPRHSERSEESLLKLCRQKERFLAPLGMTESQGFSANCEGQPYIKRRSVLYHTIIGSHSDQSASSLSRARNSHDASRRRTHNFPFTPASSGLVANQMAVS